MHKKYAFYFWKMIKCLLNRNFFEKYGSKHIPPPPCIHLVENGSAAHIGCKWGGEWCGRLRKVLPNVVVALLTAARSCEAPVFRPGFDFRACTDHSVGGTCAVKCAAGYVGLPTATCTADGWEVEGTCTRVPSPLDMISPEF